MTTGLACIAKNEDRYIDEWLKYHIKLGFDKIFVYQNDWRYSGDKSQYSNVCWFEFDGLAKQKDQLNNFAIHHWQELDWGACFDVDEFLVLKNSPTVKDALAYYQDVKVIGVPWRLFGDNGLSGKEQTDWSVLKRFTKASSHFDQYKKILINFRLARDTVKYTDPHYCNIPATDPSRRLCNINGSLFKDIDKVSISDEPMYLNHYRTKTSEELFERKSKNGSAFYGNQKFKDFGKDFKDCESEKFKEMFDEVNRYTNEVDDFTARDFLYN